MSTVINLIYVGDYQYSLMKGLKQGFEELDYDCQLIPYDQLKILKNSDATSIYVAINEYRPSYISRLSLWLNWVQDKPRGQREGWDRDKIDKNTRICFLADINILGAPIPKNVEFTYLSVGAAVPNKYQINRDIDVLVAGYIEPSFVRLYRRLKIPRVQFIEPILRRRFERLRRCYIRLVLNGLYTPFAGEVGLNIFGDKIQNLLNHAEFPEKDDAGFIDGLEMYYPRFIERYWWGKAILAVPNCKVLFCGPGWDKYPEFNEFHVGELSSVELEGLYSRSKIVIHTNSNGYGLHSRVIGAMSHGCCIITHRPVDDKLRFGAINTAFAEGVHFIYANKNNIKEKISNSLANSHVKGWGVIGENARRLVLEEHTWIKRAKQLHSEVIDNWVKSAKVYK